MKRNFSHLLYTVKQPHTAIFLSIFLLALFFRTYNIPNRYGFDGDAIRDANVAYYGATSFKFPLVGPFSSSGPFTFGPLYYYFLIAGVIIFPFFYTPWYCMLALSLGSVYLFYKIGATLYSRNLGYIVALLAAVSPPQISAGTSLSNLNPVPFFSALSILFFIACVKEKKGSYWKVFFLGLTLGIGMNMHFQSAGLLILPLLLIIYKGIRYYKKLIVVSIGFFISFIPLIYFNSIHQWHTIKGIVYSYQYIRPTIYVANSWKIYLLTFWPSFWADSLGVPEFFAIAIIASFLFFIGFATYKKKVSTPLLLLLITFFANFMYLRYYWGERHFTYFLYLQPFIIIITGIVLYQLKNLKWGQYLFAIFFLISVAFSISIDMQMLQSDGRHITYIKQVKILSQKYPNQAVSLYQCDANYQESYIDTFAYSLAHSGKMKNNGIKLGFIGGKNTCQYPLPAILRQEEATISATILAEKYFPPLERDIPITLFSNASSSALTQYGWKAISSESIYNKTVDWWK